MPDRPADSNAVEAEVYLSSGVDSYPTDINLVLEQLPIATPVVVGEAEKFRELPRGRLPVAGRHDGVVERNRHEGPADRA